MKSRNPYLSQSGFSLISVVVAMGILSIVAMMLTDLSRISTKVQQNAAVTSDVNFLVEQTRQILNTDENCTAALVGQQISGAISVHDPLAVNKLIAAEGQAIAGAAQISLIRFENLTTIINGPNQFKASLTMTVTKNMQKVIGAPLVKKNLGDIYLQLDGSGKQIVKCYGSYSSITSAKSNCLLLGGKWADENAFGTQCVYPVREIAAAAVNPIPVTPISEIAKGSVESPVESKDAKVSKEEHEDNGNHYGQVKKELETPVSVSKGGW